MHSPFKLVQFLERGIEAKAALMPDRLFGHSPIHNSSTNDIFYVVIRAHKWTTDTSSTSRQTTCRPKLWEEIIYTSCGLGDLSERVII